MINELEDRYGFAAELAKLSDEQLVARFNSQVGNRGWGNARMYFLHCLRAELESRSIDITAVVRDGHMSLSHQVGLQDDRLVHDETSGTAE